MVRLTCGLGLLIAGQVAVAVTTYEEDVKPNVLLFTRAGNSDTCVSCHGGSGGVFLNTYATASANANRSLSELQTNKMPKPPNTLSASERSAMIATLQAWINAGKPLTRAPQADAGVAQSVFGSSTVNLSALTSTDLDNNITAYQWLQISGSPTVTLQNANTASPSFTAPVVASNTVLTFRVTVTDEESLSSTDTVAITVQPPPNQAPTANAGPDQQVNERTTVTLTGAASTDPDGSIVTYAWLQTAGTAVVLSSSSAIQPTFTAPEVTIAGANLDFRLTVTDNRGSTATDTVRITVNNVNRPPVANAGPDQQADERTTVTLTGAASSDPDGTVVSYAWQQTAGTTVVLSDVAASQPTFTAPEVATEGASLTFSLTVTDNGGLTGTDTVQIMIVNQNRPPVADAGPDHQGNERATVSLTAAASSDPDGTVVSYAWQQTAGTAVILSDVAASQPTFTAPEVAAEGATLTFSLTVTDDGGLTGTDTVQIMIVNQNRPPVAAAGSAQVVNEGTAVTLSAVDSSDPDAGEPLTYFWQQLSGPAVILSGASSIQAQFTAPAVGADGAVVQLQVTVTDPHAAADTATVTVTVVNVPAVLMASAGVDQIVREGSGVAMAGTASPGEGRTIAAVNWLQIGGASVQLTGEATTELSFTAPVAGALGTALEFRFTVTDDEGTQAFDTVQVWISQLYQWTLQPGWNLISSPVDSVQTLKAIFGEGANRLTTGPIWYWDGRRFLTAADGEFAQANRGYWVFLRAKAPDQTAEFIGIAASTAPVLQAGRFALLGPSESTVRGAARAWEVRGRGLQPIPAGATLEPLRGYWFYSDGGGPAW